MRRALYRPIEPTIQQMPLREEPQRPIPIEQLIDQEELVRTARRIDRINTWVQITIFIPGVIWIGIRVLQGLARQGELPWQ